MKQALRILHVEDSLEDSMLVEAALLAAGFKVALMRVETRGEFIEALRSDSLDLVISDCALPQFSGFQALEIAQALKPEIPFIFVSGTIGEEAAIECLHLGASDYVLKDRPARLVPAIRRAIEVAEEKSLRQAMETQLRQARKLEAIGRMTGGIAHDFNNLLQVLKIQLGLLDMVAMQPEKVRTISRMLDRAVTRATDMTGELMLFARKTEVKMTSVHVPDRVSETLELIRASMPANITLDFSFEGPLPKIFADHTKLDRILTNLIVNAKDAMPSGGKIVVSADVIRFDPPVLNFSQGEDAPYLRITVSDTGSGMDEYTLRRAFEPFFTTKPAGKGTGLGLPVIFGLMQAHNGFIDIQSKVGKGTLVSLFFPLPQPVSKQINCFKAISPVRTCSAAA